VKPAIVYAATESYVLGLAASMSSLARTSFAQGAAVIVIDAGLRAQSRVGLRQCVPSAWEVSFVRLPARWTSHLPDPGRFSPAAYGRFFVGHVAGDSHRVIYLDADTLMLKPVDPLMELELNGAAVAAVRDEYIPTFGAHPRLPGWCGILEPDVPYFNSGVLLIDVPKWRSLRVFERASDYLRQAGGAVEYVDQDALNVAFCGSWTELSPEWNVGRFWYRPERRSGCFEDISDRARILHYTTEYKPWLMPNSVPHWARAPFFEALDQTWWGGWRPLGSREDGSWSGSSGRRTASVSTPAGSPAFAPYQR
jgi:lipopolysaccharide biosynthesis glycosyltransferase